MMVKVTIINSRCVHMPEAVSVPSLMIMTLIVSEESLAGDTQTRQTFGQTFGQTDKQTDIQTDRQTDKQTDRLWPFLSKL